MSDITVKQLLEKKRQLQIDLNALLCKFNQGVDKSAGVMYVDINADTIVTNSGDRMITAYNITVKLGI